MENTANLEMFAVHKIFSEYAERIYAYIEKTPRDIKLCISQLITIQMLKFLDYFFLHYMGWIKPNNHLTLLSLKVLLYFARTDDSCSLTMLGSCGHGYSIPVQNSSAVVFAELFSCTLHSALDTLTYNRHPNLHPTS